MTAVRPELAETAFQAQVVKVAKLFGWWIWHDNSTQGRNVAGLPDLILIRERVIWAELKKETGRVSRAQRDVTALLHGADAEVYLWRPADLPEIQRVLGYRRASSVSVLERLEAVLALPTTPGAYPERIVDVGERISYVDGWNDAIAAVRRAARGETP